MKDRKGRIEGMRREIERRGGTTWTSGKLPEAMQERFLQTVLNCPCCKKEVESRDPFHSQGTARNDS